ncbi:MAG: hypothetical protein O9353_11010, partial [Bacteroidia bacterium]|nr:hypothetical protein [Bacteroidia bacterium]
MWSLECVFEETGITYHYAVLETRKNTIGISRRGSTSDLHEVLAVAKKASAPLCLVLTGKGMMLKKIMFSENDTLDLKELLQQHLPAIPSSEFYTQFYQNENGSGHIALCRKEQLDQLLAQVSNQKAEVANVYIGPAVC